MPSSRSAPRRFSRSCRFPPFRLQGREGFRRTQDRSTGVVRSSQVRAESSNCPAMDAGERVFRGYAKRDRLALFTTGNIDDEDAILDLYQRRLDTKRHADILIMAKNFFHGHARFELQAESDKGRPTTGLAAAEVSRPNPRRVSMIPRSMAVTAVGSWTVCRLCSFALSSRMMLGRSALCSKANLRSTTPSRRAAT